MNQQFDPEIWLTERKSFLPDQWLQQPDQKKQQPQSAKNKTATRKEHEVEVVLRRVEAFGIDLTCSYDDWFKMGCAFTEGFGEAGREYFHQVSRLNAGYDYTKCNEQFDECLKGRKTGITLSTFFAAAHDAGINVKI
jgi:hypothetical protein